MRRCYGQSWHESGQAALEYATEQSGLARRVSTQSIGPSAPAPARHYQQMFGQRQSWLPDEFAVSNLNDLPGQCQTLNLRPLRLTHVESRIGKMLCHRLWIGSQPMFQRRESSALATRAVAQATRETNANLRALQVQAICVNYSIGMRYLATHRHDVRRLRVVPGNGLTDHRASKAQKCSAFRQLGDLHLQHAGLRERCMNHPARARSAVASVEWKTGGRKTL